MGKMLAHVFGFSLGIGIVLTAVVLMGVEGRAHAGNPDGEVRILEGGFSGIILLLGVMVGEAQLYCLGMLAGDSLRDGRIISRKYHRSALAGMAFAAMLVITARLPGSWPLVSWLLTMILFVAVGHFAPKSRIAANGPPGSEEESRERLEMPTKVD
jgi:hypothetical protein